MPCVKWGIGTRYCRSFQRRHSICPIRVSCITGSPGLNRVKWNRIEQYRIVFDGGMSALRRDFPSRSFRFSVVIVSLFYNREEGGGKTVDYVQKLTRRSITCRKYLGQGSQGRFPRVQSYRVRLRGCRKFLEPIIVNFV